MRKNLFLVVILLVALVSFTFPVAAQSASTNNEAVSASRPALAIKAPPAAGVGEKVQIKVAALPGGAPVVGAGVWAVDIKDNSTPSEISSSDLNKVGVFLGWTDKTGVLTCVFHEVSRYLLITCKDGYTPGFAWITIQPLKEMALKGPESAYTGQTCEFTVYETNSGGPVAGAGVWAIRVEDEVALTDTSEDSLSLVISKGILIGYTNNQGQVVHAFDKSGHYFLAAVKPGYKPAFNKISIIDLKQMAIRNPEAVQVLEPVKIQAVEINVLPVETPVPGAGVWAVPFMNTLDSLTNYDNIVQYGLFLGWTDQEGYVSPKPIFKDPGHYWLVAFKDGYVPAVGKISVEPLKEMVIKGPATALVGQNCEYTVYDTNSGSAVPGAGVWAMLMQNQTELSSENLDAAAYVTAHGIFLGYTDNQGQVFHVFDKSGKYLIMAFMQGYKPAFCRTTIKEVPELAIRAPEKVSVLTPVPIKVVEKSVLTVEIPVAGVGVWAISQDKAAKLDKSADYAALAKTNGIFLGWTNQTGYVSPLPRFNSAGRFWLIAIKEGYAPGVSQITVTAPQKATATPVTPSAKSTTKSQVSTK
jgi:hypothetical protein